MSFFNTCKNNREIVPYGLQEYDSTKLPKHSLCHEHVQDTAVVTSEEESSISLFFSAAVVFKFSGTIS